MNREKRYRTIGKALPRVEAAQKALGQTRYSADIPLPGLLWAKVLRSPHPHARIVSVDVSKARDLAGVHAALTGRDLPEVLVGKRVKDMPVLAREKVRYVGEPVAAVAAESLEIAEEALGLIEVEYEELASVTDPLEAMKPNAPRLHDDPARYRNAPALRAEIPNLQSAKIWEHGDLGAAWEKAERVFEHTFRTQLTHHGYLEPHACVVSVVPSVMDIPRLQTIILESPTGPVPYQGKAIGEIPNVPTAAAIANAIADAAGVRFFELPISAEKLYWGFRNNHASLLTP